MLRKLHLGLESALTCFRSVEGSLAGKHESWQFARHLCVHNDEPNFLSSCWLYLFRFFKTDMFGTCLLIKGLCIWGSICEDAGGAVPAWDISQIEKLICGVRCNCNFFYKHSHFTCLSCRHKQWLKCINAYSLIILTLLANLPCILNVWLL